MDFCAKYHELLQKGQVDKQIDINILKRIADLLRTEICDSISQSGGHIGSSMGTIELTIAMYFAFDFQNDDIIWDIGHQSYGYKILTGRNLRLLRTEDGCAPFSDIHESKYDKFGGGHSSTSISAALGIMIGRNHDDNRYIVPVIGDAAMSAGLAFEALNNIPNTIDIPNTIAYKGVNKSAEKSPYQGAYKSADNLIIILNDNQMSISPSVGRLNDVFKSKEKSESYFHAFGLKYYGIVDGHNFDALIQSINHCKNNKGPFLLHVKTNKGHSLENAGQCATKIHATAPFNQHPSASSPKADNTYQYYIASKVLKYMDDNPNIFAISPAMVIGSRLDVIAKRYPDRVFDVGIAEQHALTFSAGIAMSGKMPFVFIYSTFLQRAYDQLIHDIIVQNININIFIDRAGLAGYDGATHHGIFDIQMVYGLPNSEIFSPFYQNDIDYAMQQAMLWDGVSFIRYPKGIITKDNINPQIVYTNHANGIKNNNASISQSMYISYGNSHPKDANCKNQHKQKEGILIITYGTGNEIANQVVDHMDLGINCNVLNLVKLYPIDIELIVKYANQYSTILVIDESFNGILAKNIKNHIECHIFYIHSNLPSHNSIEKQRELIKINKDAIINYLRQI